MENQWQRYKELELIADSEPQPRTIRATRQAWLHEIWQALDIALFRDLESRMWQSIDKTGRTSWHIYNPKTGNTLDLTSNDEICMWLEQLFYQY